MVITKYARRLHKLLLADGWNATTEASGPHARHLDPYFQSFECSRRRGPLDVFTRMTATVMSSRAPQPKDGDFFFCFDFHADPELIGPDKRAFGQKVRANGCGELRVFTEDLIRRCKLKHDGLSEKAVRPHPIDWPEKIDFGREQDEAPAYEVYLSYRIPIESLRKDLRHGHRAEPESCLDASRRITVVPAIRRLELRHFGGWEELDLEFRPGLNIITGESPARCNAYFGP
jgi:hypothetical protein